MNDRELINDMQRQGKIDADQAKLLTEALEESEARKKRIFEQVERQQKVREKGALGFLLIWVGIIFLGLLLLIPFVGMHNLNRDRYLAINDFNKAGFYLEKEDYPAALDLIQRGIRKAPNFPVGYELSGLTQKILYEKIRDENYRIQAQAALAKARELSQTQKGARQMTGPSLFFILIFGVLALSSVVLFLLFLYNILIKREERVNALWAQIAALCQRKLDLIPVLIETVKGYAAHEQTTLHHTISARTKADEIMKALSATTVADPEKLKEIVDLQPELTSGVKKILAVAEQYPQLKADQHYLALQAQFENTEDGIARMRQAYNQSVQSYNAALRLFPVNLVAAAFNLTARKYFELETVK